MWFVVALRDEERSIVVVDSFKNVRRRTLDLNGEGYLKDMVNRKTGKCLAMFVSVVCLVSVVEVVVLSGSLSIMMVSNWVVRL